ncbi:M-phase phosphoprotein 6-like [Ciona intestinalis]
MTQEKKEGSKLSLNLRKMKFMQRCLGEEAKRELEESENRGVTSEHWELDLPNIEAKPCKYLILDSYNLCDNFKYGRLSYGGYNKVIEKLMEEFTKKDVEVESDVSISDEEMTERFNSLVGNVAKRFTKTKSGNKKSRKLEDNVTNVKKKVPKLDNKGFMKPELD